jgi:membrane fusion protein (multidrug efflux system)
VPSPLLLPDRFSRSRFLLRSDSFRRGGLWIVLGFLLLGAWLTWFLGAELRVYEVAVRARLEAAAALHPVQPAVGGRIAVVYAELGQEVQAGDLLFALETEEQRFELIEAETRLEAQRAQLAAVGQELELVRRLFEQQRETAAARLQAARSQRQVEAIVGRFAEAEDQRAKRLNDLGLLSDLDRMRFRGEVEKSRARAQTEEDTLEVLEAELKGQETDLAIRAAHLEHEQTTLSGEERALAAHIEHLRHELEERRITAPVAGRIARLSEVRPQAVVEAGAVLAEVVPEGVVRAVGWFPVSSVGRLRPGQPAWLRLEAYPWIEHGAVEAVVERVASEPEDGLVRVELALRGERRPGLPLEHGLTAAAEVAVERLTPGRWVLRAAGGSFRPGATPHG